jgi:outer membrane protein assembly factor BamB
MRRIALTVLALSLFCSVTFAADDWTQHGGPNRDFSIGAQKLSQDWGEKGPETLWEQKLGDGFSAIVTDGKTLYTHYRNDGKEIVVALDAKSGETKWEYGYDVPIPDVQSLSTQYGEGPQATPLLVDGKLVTFGFMGHLTCVDAKTGELQWAHALGESHEVPVLYFGHSASPLAIGRKVVVAADGVLAFDLSSGERAWENRELDGTYGSPILHENGSIVTPLDGHLAAFNAQNGKLLWKVEHKNQWGTLLHTPVVDDSGRIVLSASQVGTIIVDPAQKERAPIWNTKKMQVGHSNIVRDGDHIYGSTGGASSFIVATSLKDGSQAWKERGFGRTNFIKVGEQFLILDFDAKLALVNLSPDGMKVITQATIGEQPTWTPPTLIGTTLYFRDEQRIAAFDLGKSAD